MSKWKMIRHFPVVVWVVLYIFVGVVVEVVAVAEDIFDRIWSEFVDDEIVEEFVDFLVLETELVVVVD